MVTKRANSGKCAGIFSKSCKSQSESDVEESRSEVATEESHSDSSVLESASPSSPVAAVGRLCTMLLFK